MSLLADDESSEGLPGPRAVLELPYRIGDLPSLWPLVGRVITVGRADECQLVMTDERISRFHAAFVPTAWGVWVVDLAAREGVYVNGESVRWAWLDEGDTVRMGRIPFILRYQSPPNGIRREDVPLEAGAAPREQPGTELAVRSEPSGTDRAPLAIPARRPPSVASLSPRVARAPEPVVPVRGEVWEPPVAFPQNPMAMWQQQMQLMESFHNDMIMMVQMFVAMHREHMSSVRHELDMVQKLTGELAVLQAKMAQPASAEDPAPDTASERPAKERRSVPAEDRKKEETQPSAERTDRDTRGRPKPAEPRDGVKPGGSKVPIAKSPAPGQFDESPPLENSQVHAVLSQRIAQLQRERQGYWQRILSSINR